MPYIYNDEDNNSMNDPFDGPHNPTVYSSRDEMEWYESGEYDRYMDALQDAKDLRRCQIREGFLDDMGFARDSKCRECPWMIEGVIEAFEDQADDDLIMPGDAYDTAQRMCKVCKTHREEEREDALDAFFREEDGK